MAKLVIGAASSHGPGIQRPVEMWRAFGERDRRDPRFDYEALLKDAPPGLERDLEPSVQRRRQSAIRAALATLSERVAQARPDLALIVSNAHVVRSDRLRPVFALVRAAELPFAASTGVTFEDGDGEEPLLTAPGHPELADHLIDALNGAGFDVGCLDAFGGGERLDEAFAFCYRWMFGGTAIPTLPFYLSRDLPGQPHAARCIDLGHALRRCVESFPGNLRVALICSGGLSHQIVDEALDRHVTDALCSGAFDDLARLDRLRLNRAPGTPEILNWIMVGAAMAPSRMDLLAYEPCFRSPAGTGFGGAVATWSQSVTDKKEL